MGSLVGHVGPYIRACRQHQQFLAVRRTVSSAICAHDPLGAFGTRQPNSKVVRVLGGTFLRPTRRVVHTNSAAFHSESCTPTDALPSSVN
jgi:hypothetical protein